MEGGRGEEGREKKKKRGKVMSRARRAGREDGRRAQEEGERHQKFMHVLKTHTHTRHTRARTHTHTHTHRHTHTHTEK